jgi:hypothetical protein
VLLGLSATNLATVVGGGAGTGWAAAVGHRAARIGTTSAKKTVLLGSVTLACAFVIGAFYLPGLRGAPGGAAPRAAITAGRSAPTPRTTGSLGPDPTASPGAGPAATAGADAGQPVRAAFYYPWYPENVTPSGSHYTPSAGRYSVDVPATVDRQIEDMQYGGLQAGIASWWGAGKREDNRLPLLLSEGAKLGFSWSVYYEEEGYSNPSVEQISSDLAHLRRYTDQKAWLHVDGKPVIFVFGDGGDNCATAARWAQANRSPGFFVVMKVFPGYTACADQPQGWHQYASGLDVQRGYSAVLSPGFWKYDATKPTVVRDLARFRQDALTVATSGAPFQLIVSYNEWGEGTAVESSTDWASTSGHGAYLDILHEVFTAHPR